MLADLSGSFVFLKSSSFRNPVKQFSTFVSQALSKNLRSLGKPVGFLDCVTFLPVHHARSVQVFHSQHQLPDVFLGLPLIQALLVIDAVHEVPTGAQLHHEVVAVLRLQDVQELSDVGVADHLLDVTLPPQVLGHIRILLGLPLVNHLYRHLEKLTSLARIMDIFTFFNNAQRVFLRVSKSCSVTGVALLACHGGITRHWPLPPSCSQSGATQALWGPGAARGGGLCVL